MKKKRNESLTLDAQYNKKINEFEKRQNKIIKLQKDLKVDEKKLNYFIKKTKKKMTDKDFEEYFKLIDDIKVKEGEINNLNSFKNESEYFLNTGNILSEYYSEKQNIEKNVHHNSNNTNKIDNTNSSFNPSVIDFFFNKTHSINHTILLNNYLQKINENYTKKKITKINTSVCKVCNIEMLVYNIEGILECPQCSRIEYNVMDYSKPSYKDPPPEISYFAYKRLNHFNELRRIYAKYNYLHHIYLVIYSSLNYFE